MDIQGKRGCKITPGRSKAGSRWSKGRVKVLQWWKVRPFEDANLVPGDSFKCEAGVGRWITWAEVSVKWLVIGSADCQTLNWVHLKDLITVEVWIWDEEGVILGQYERATNYRLQWLWCSERVLQAAAPREIVKTYPVTPISSILHIKQASMTS